VLLNAGLLPSSLLPFPGGFGREIDPGGFASGEILSSTSCACYEALLRQRLLCCPGRFLSSQHSLTSRFSASG